MQVHIGRKKTGLGRIIHKYQTTLHSNSQEKIINMCKYVNRYNFSCNKLFQDKRQGYISGLNIFFKYKIQAQLLIIAWISISLSFKLYIFLYNKFFLLKQQHWLFKRLDKHTFQKNFLTRFFFFCNTTEILLFMSYLNNLC